MTMTAESLPDDPTELKKIILDLKQQNDYLLEQFHLLRHRQFGASSEASPQQASLFNDAEALSVSEEVEEANTQTVSSHTRHAPKRKPLPDHLPRETVVVDIPDTEKVCDGCGSALHEMGRETREQLEFVPAHVKVIETVRPKYACRACEQSGTESIIKIAPVPPSPIPKGVATASLLAHIVISKYQYALPLYRLESLFAHYGIDLNRKTMAQWVLRCAELLMPLYQALKQHQLQQPVIHADETPLTVIHSDKQKSYMWVYCTGTDSPQSNHPLDRIVLYDFHNSRAASCAQTYLGDFQGYLQVDGYVGYEQTHATLVGCWAHVRRKLMDAKKVQPKGKTGKADWALNLIQKLYAIESQCKTVSPEQRYEIRQEKSVPLLNELKSWLEKSLLTVTPKSALGTALAYCERQWPKLIRYTVNGLLAIDNNRAERAIKPFVIGRKNWLCVSRRRSHDENVMLTA